MMRIILIPVFFISFVVQAKTQPPKDIIVAADQYEKSDLKMNLDYIDLMKSIDNKILSQNEISYHQELKKRIVYNQRAWLNYRDSYCELTALREGNTRAVLYYEINCMAEQTKERIKYLLLLNQLVAADARLASLP